MKKLGNWENCFNCWSKVLCCFCCIKLDACRLDILIDLSFVTCCWRSLGWLLYKKKLHCATNYIKVKKIHRNELTLFVLSFNGIWWVLITVELIPNMPNFTFLALWVSVSSVLLWIAPADWQLWSKLLCLIIASVNALN